jgi:Abi-like protein
MDPQDQRRITAFVADLHRPISRERLETYRSPNGTDLDMLVAYFWNVALSEALYPTILAFEVALRNTIHMTLSQQYGTPLWFDRANLLEQRERDAIAAARDQLRRSQKQATDGRIVAALSFKFWVFMFNRPYEAKIWQRNNNIAVLRRAFPRLPTTFRSRAAVERRCEEIRVLRNRIAHAEPIWNRPNRDEEHRNIVRAIKWINPQLEVAVRKRDRFQDVYGNGRRIIERDLRTQLGFR